MTGMVYKVKQVSQNVSHQLNDACETKLEMITKVSVHAMYCIYLK